MTVKGYIDPETMIFFPVTTVRKSTIDALDFYGFEDDRGEKIKWSQGQLEIIDCILNRCSPDGLLKRIQIEASTQYGKSLAVAAGVTIRASLHPEPWAIVAGTEQKAQIIMEYCIMLALNNEVIRTQLTPDTPLDRLRMKRSADRLTFRRKGQIRVFSAEAKRVTETSKSLMGYGSPNVVEDEAALIGDTIQATVMRMLGGTADNFLVKIGNPFNRGHFLTTWKSGRYYRIFIDYHRALDEGRYTPEFIEEMKLEALFDILYECKYPAADMIDAKGWASILTPEEIRRAFVEAEQGFGYYRLGCDVAGGGRNFSVVVLRAYNVATLLFKENVKDTMLFTGKILEYSRQLGVLYEDIAIDKNGIGRGVYDRVAEVAANLPKPVVPVGFNGGDEPMESYRFFNKRAEAFWRTREWILRGGKLEKNEEWLQLADVKYKVDSSGKVKMMSKEEMLKNGVDSPDVADALSMTFAQGEPVAKTSNQKSTTVTISSLDPYPYAGQQQS